MKKNQIMIQRIIFALVLMAMVEISTAQTYKPSAKTDHLAIVVDDLGGSAKFYSEVFGLNEITNQTQNPSIRWFAFADGVELHLIQRSKEGIQLKKDVHLAVAINDLPAFMKMLEEKGIHFENWPGEPKTSNTRPDGIKQVYLQDPDGYWIEVNDADRF